MKTRYFFYGCKDGAVIYAGGEHKYASIILAMDDESDVHFHGLLKMVAKKQSDLSLKTPLYEISATKAKALTEKGYAKKVFVPMNSDDQLFNIKDKLNVAVKEKTSHGLHARLKEAEIMITRLKDQIQLPEDVDVDDDLEVPGLPVEKEPDILAFEIDESNTFDLPEGIEEGEDLSGESPSEAPEDEDPMDLELDEKPKPKKIKKTKLAKKKVK